MITETTEFTLETGMEVHGEGAAYGGRLDWVRGLVNNRMASLSKEGRLPAAPAWRNRPAYELHIMSGLADILADHPARMALRHIVAHGQTAHVVVFIHEDAETAAAAFAAVSGRLASELMTGHSLRHISGRVGPVVGSGSGPSTEAPYGAPPPAAPARGDDEGVPATTEPGFREPVPPDSERPVGDSPGTGGDAE